MHKIKKVRKDTSARQPAIRSACTVSKPAQKPTTKSSKRKPLTAEQRERKNAHDREVRAKRKELKRLEARGCQKLPERRGSCGSVPCRQCDKFSRCRELARTDKFPKLHAVKPGLVPVERKTCDMQKPATVRRELSPLQVIGAWVQENLARLEQTKASGIAHQVFSIPGGVAEVSVCRRVCEIQPRHIARPSLLDAVRQAMLRPEQLFTPDFLVNLRKVWDTHASHARYWGFDFGDEIVQGHARRGLTWAGEAPDPQ